ncbi:MAG: hypothetical protein KKD39_08430 [Candidatus Altiarchaeota archaeon]|nr:hypothetical protein [Candidatus Altiarchaeota archaeon]
MPDLDRKFLKTLIAMWENPDKRNILEAEGTTQDVIDEAKEKLRRLKK